MKNRKYRVLVDNSAKVKKIIPWTILQFFIFIDKQNRKEKQKYKDYIKLNELI